MKGKMFKGTHPAFSTRLSFVLSALLLFSVVFPLTTFAAVRLEYFKMDVPYVCPAETASLSWGMSSTDSSAKISCAFDFNGDGTYEKVLYNNCPLTGQITFTPEKTGRIKPVLRVKVNGSVVAKKETSGIIHSSPKAYSRGREVIRFGKYAPADFYATDVAVDKNGKVYVTDWLRSQVVRYSSDGTKELEMKSSIFMTPRRLTVDLNGNVYVTDAYNDAVHIFNKAGREVAVWDIMARFGHGVGAGGIKFVAPDRIMLAANNSVNLLDLNGDLVFRFGQFSGILDACMAPDGSYYVVDKSSRLQKFDSNGNFLWTIGKTGTLPGQFNQPVAVAADANGNVYVSDRMNSRIQKFSSNGNFLLQWGSKGHNPGQFFNQIGIAVAPLSSNIWVAGYHSNDVQEFTPTGQLVSRWKGHVTGLGEFANAAGIAATIDKVFVVDYMNQQVKVFDKATGAPLYQFGERGEGEGTVFNFPRAITLAPSGDLYITEDRNIRRIKQDGTFVKVFPPLLNNINGSLGISVRNGIMYQADTNNDKLNARDVLDGSAIWIAGSEGTDPGQFTLPRGIAITVGAGPLLLVTDSQMRVQTFSLSGDFVRQWSTFTPEGDPAFSKGIAFDPTRRIVYVGGVGSINAFDMCGTPLFSWAPELPPNTPIFDYLTVDEQGAVFATDRQGTVYGFVPE